MSSFYLKGGGAIFGFFAVFVFLYLCSPFFGGLTSENARVASGMFSFASGLGVFFSGVLVIVFLSERWLLRRQSEHPVYVMFWRNRVATRDITGRCIVQDAGVEDAFSNERLLVADKRRAVKALSGALWKLFDRDISLAPILVLHPLGQESHKLSDDEREALVQIGREAGAYSVVIRDDDRELTNDEIVSCVAAERDNMGVFPASGSFFK